MYIPYTYLPEIKIRIEIMTKPATYRPKVPRPTFNATSTEHPLTRSAAHRAYLHIYLPTYPPTHLPTYALNPSLEGSSKQQGI